jgi:hypothetical protein
MLGDMILFMLRVLGFTATCFVVSVVLVGAAAGLLSLLPKGC